MMEQVLFYIFASLLLLSAMMVILLRNMVAAALFLVLAFFFSAVIWLLLEAEFLSITLVLVYVGAVMVLFMFVVMMLDINDVSAAKRIDFKRYLPVSIVVALLMAISMVLVLYFAEFEWASDEVQRHGADYSNTKELGIALYTGYLYAFEVAGAILLVAIIAAIVLAMDGVRLRKAQQPWQQVNAQRSLRLRVVKMQADEVVDGQDKPSSLPES